MFEWADYLEVARSLEDPQHEARARSAISRAYYAAFHCARRYLLRRNPEAPLPRHGGVHEDVISRLQSKGQPREAFTAARRLASLKRERTWADYDPRSTKNLEKTLGQALADAEWIIRQLGGGELP